MSNHSSVFEHLLRQAKPQTAKKQQQPSSNSLAVVRPRASCVLSAPLEDAWSAVREWAPLNWLPAVDGRKVQGILLTGDSNTSVGAVRAIRIGEQQLFEKLVALDDEKHILKWRLISHPETINPFLASFVNYQCTMRMQSITVGNNAFIDWEGEFFTESEHAEGMKAILERWYITGFQALQNYLLAMDNEQELDARVEPARNPQVGSTDRLSSMAPAAGGSIGASPRAVWGRADAGISGSGEQAPGQWRAQSACSDPSPSVQGSLAGGQDSSQSQARQGSSLPSQASHDALRMQLLQGAHASLVSEVASEVARQMALASSGTAPPHWLTAGPAVSAAAAKSSSPEGNSLWMSGDAQSLSRALARTMTAPPTRIPGSHENEDSQAAGLGARSSLDMGTRSSAELLQSSLEIDRDISKGSSSMSDQVAPLPP